MRIKTMLGHLSSERAVWGLLLAATASTGRAQNPALAPTSDLTVIVSSFPINYGSITIPAGVRVRFVAPGYGSLALQGIPAVLLCDGDALVDGELSLGGNTTGWVISNTRAAGWVVNGQGQPGACCGGIWSGFGPAMGGRHAGVYGTVLPFSLEGGSHGGEVRWYDPGCWVYQSTSGGGYPGGTLVLHARGRIEVGGRVTADGDYGGSGGSGGSVLLRGETGVWVRPNGSVTARGGTTIYSMCGSHDPLNLGGPGYIRIDSWGAPPLLQGVVDPAPTVVELPFLRAAAPPQTGATWVTEVFAPENAPIFLSGSLQAGPGIPTPFGILGLHLPTAAGIALTMVQPGHDPVASVPLQVPASPVFVGLGLWLQAFVVPPALPPRLTNTLAAIVQ